MHHSLTLSRLMHTQSETTNILHILLDYRILSQGALAGDLALPYATNSYATWCSQTFCQCHRQLLTKLSCTFWHNGLEILHFSCSLVAQNLHTKNEQIYIRAKCIPSDCERKNIMSTTPNRSSGRWWSGLFLRMIFVFFCFCPITWW